ncbi:MAG: acyl-CoA ligase (AMP-forming), exosortase A system-associated [Methylococcales bacterium]|nr:acyl-CoA ligase (AMP-forming), exosortase A system-associated [Methylococcales bacterium]
MHTNLAHWVANSAESRPDAIALIHKKTELDYAALWQAITREALALSTLPLSPQQRVAVYLPKQIETVISFFAANLAGLVFVPVNPVLKAGQVQHILNDCHVRVLITSSSRWQSLKENLLECPGLDWVILVDDSTETGLPALPYALLSWFDFLGQAATKPLPATIDTQMAAILYTSGSTGKPKGVVLSHRNMICGAQSVAEYLEITEHDRLLAALPFSFDYGLNQLTTAMLKGGQCVLLDYLLPRDVVLALDRYRITGLAAVPPLWAQLAKINWPDEAGNGLRYLTNSGGKMPKAVLDAIRAKAPKARFYLMYGLTEAFRSTYLPPEQIDRRPDSMGKAIPNAEVLVVRPDGTPCAPHEPGELVHKGSLVAMGYWNDPVKTAERFKPAPGALAELPLTEIAVWSGDRVTLDEEGYLYFVGRTDDMIKTSGYRVSPTEVEEVLYASGQVSEAAAIGIEHPTLGQAVVAVVSVETGVTLDAAILKNHCRAKLPNFMVPERIEQLSALPKNANGKIDRKALVGQFQDLYR